MQWWRWLATASDSPIKPELVARGLLGVQQSSARPPPPASWSAFKKAPHSRVRYLALARHRLSFGAQGHTDHPSHRRVEGRARVKKTASRAEDGGNDYTFSAEINDPGVIRITEKWRDLDALAAHFRSPKWPRSSRPCASTRLARAR